MKPVRPARLAVPTVLVAVLATGCGGGEGDVASDPGGDAPESVSVEEVTWNDGSLGCARDGEMYTQAQVDGLRITVVVGGETYEYHSGGGRDPFLCDDPTQ